MLRHLTLAKSLASVVTFAAIAAFASPTVSAQPTTAAAQANLGDRDLAKHSLTDMQSAIDQIVRTEDGSAVGRKAYATAALQARNALIGRKDRDYIAKVGDPGDGVGAIGYIDRLLDRSAVETWTDGMRGAKINLLAAAQSLTDALGAKQMEDYQTDLTGAMADISLAMGRPSQAGVLGGVEGALATTSLGIPEGAKTVSGCAIPSVTPAYGLAGGRLAFLALDRRAAATLVPSDFPVRRIEVVGNRLVLYSASASDLAHACSRPKSTARADVPVRTVARREPTRAVAKSSRVKASLVSFTSAQAHAGVAIYAQNCLSCHGANLQGVAAPAVAGKEFLTQVKGDGWTFADLRNLVVQQMPLSNPGSLSPKQYAAVIAYLLASNCYAPGPKAFPTAEDPKLASVKILAPHGARTDNARLATCRVR